MPLDFSSNPLLEAMFARPGMFLSEKSLRAFHGFIGGYQAALGAHGIQGDKTFSFIPDDFHEWVAYRTRFEESTSGWCNMILATTASEEAAFDRFFELIEEHGNRIPRKIARVRSPKGYYYDSSRPGGSAYPSSIALIAYTDDPGFFPVSEIEGHTFPGEGRFTPRLDWLYLDAPVENYEILDEQAFQRLMV
jgi:hypothetical protein